MLCMGAFIGGGRIPQPEQEILNGGSYYDFYKTKDGRFFSVGSLEPQFRKLLCEALDIPELIDNTFNDSYYTQIRFKEAVHDAFLSKTYEEWLEVFNEDFEGCVEPVLTFPEACEHPQLKAREMIVTIPKSDGTMQNKLPLRLNLMVRPEYKHVGAKLGEHNEEVLLSLGFNAEQIKALKEKGVLE